MEPGDVPVLWITLGRGRGGSVTDYTPSVPFRLFMILVMVVWFLALVATTATEVFG